MRVDFYQLTRDPAEAAVADLAAKTLARGERMLVVCADEALRGRISDALWTRDPESFLAHGLAGSEHDERQPILIAESVEAANGARFVLYADGQWRPSEGFERAFLLFGEETIVEARQRWRELGQEGEGERHFHRQDESGRWREVASG